MPIRYVAKKVKDFCIYRVLSLNDTPHRIALGVAVGFFVTWTPTIGLQMLLIIAISALLRANKVVGVPFAWISNPATLWIYVPNYFVGTRLLGAKFNVSKLMTGLNKAFGLSGSLHERFRDLARVIWELFWPLWIGSLIVGVVVGVAAYITTYYGVVAYRSYRHHRHPLADADDEQIKTD